MQKLFLIASLALLPLTAHAQSGGDQVIQAAADELKPAFCANDLKQAIQIVEGCYAKVDEDSEKYNMNQCVIEDLFVFGVVKMKQKQYTNNFQTDPYANLDYVKPININLRISKHPSFMAGIINDQETQQQMGDQIGRGISKILRQENCLDPEKLK